MSIKTIIGDCREVLKTLADESVHCVVTSPPYWGLRDYGTAKWDGGDPECDHIKGEMRRGINLANSVHSTRGGAKKIAEVADIPFGNICGKCGAHRIDSQIGLEPSLQEYIETIRNVFADVRRVLRKDGTLWLNLGDCYHGGGYANHKINGEKWLHAHGGDRRRSRQQDRINANPGLKPKDLCGIPWRIALALQADGWYLRSDIIWSKLNPMPESVTDRPTKAHEYLFLLTKSPRYYYDAEAIREPLAEKTFTTFGCKHRPQGNDALGKGKSDNWGKSLDVRKPKLAADGSISGANKRSVWEVATSPFPEAHFATFPPALVEPCIKAGCPEKVCAKCGSPWIREIEIGEPDKETTRGQQAWTAITGQRDNRGGLPYRECACNWEYTASAGTVLDPFGGAGTTGLVADRLGRNAILIELNPEYADMTERRIRDDAGMFFESDTHAI